MTYAIHIQKDPKGLERGSGGTRKTVGHDGGGLTFDLRVDRNYSDARKRWESQLPEDGRREAIMREAATMYYYTSIIEEVDPTDRELSRRGFEQRVQWLLLSGWEYVTGQIENNPMLTGPSMAMWVELRKKKTPAEILL